MGISCQVLEPYKSYLGGNPGSGSRSFYLDQCFCVLRIKAPRRHSPEVPPLQAGEECEKILLKMSEQNNIIYLFALVNDNLLYLAIGEVEELEAVSQPRQTPQDCVGETGAGEVAGHSVG